MKILGKIFALCFISISANLPIAAHAQYFTGIYTGPEYSISDDSIVYDNAVVGFQKLYVTDNVVLENNGIITSDIYLTTANNLTFQNSGNMTGSVYLSERSVFIQYIESNADANMLNVVKSDNSLFIVKAYHANVDYAKLTAAASGADRLILEDSVINFTATSTMAATMADSGPGSIEIAGEILVILDYWDSSIDIKLFDDVTGNGKINFQTGSVGLFTPVAQRRADGIWIVAMRESDYEKIMGENLGKFLNDLRLVNPNSKMLADLDSQPNLPDLYRAMDNYAAFNPGKLMEPLRAMNAADIGMSSDFTHYENNGGIKTAVIFNDSTEMTVTKMTGGVSLDNLKIGAAFILGLDRDAVNESNGSFYGIDLFAKYDLDNFYVMSKLSGMAAIFEDISVYNDDVIVNNPVGLMLSGYTEFGYEFASDEFYLVPMVHIRADISTIARDLDYGIYAGAGLRIGYADEFLGIRTNRSVFASIENGNYNIGARYDFKSISDGISGGAYFSRLSGIFGKFYKIGVEFRMDF